MADPTAVNEKQNPGVNLSPEEKRLFAQVFQAADKENLGVVTGDVAFAFFPPRTKLPGEVLGEIWQIADTEDKGFLTPNGFYIVLRLIGYAQAGKPVNIEAALKAGPLPRFEGINASAGGADSASAASTSPLQPQASGGPIRVPPLMPDKATRYAALFEDSGARNGLLPGATAKQIFDRAQLPNDVLVKIWNLADTEMRGMLSCTEFIIAMHVLASFRDGSMRALPQSLPAGLYDAAARRGAPPSRPLSGQRAAPGSPPASAVPRQLTGGPARTSSPLAQQSYHVPPVPPQSTGGSQPAAEGWVITASEKAKYDEQFAKLDPTGKGFIGGDEAVGFFSNSGLSENQLAQIWDLSDIKSEGRLSRDEFSVAIHLILQTVQTKAPIPTTLPANLIPPSMRGAVAETQKSTAPEFEQPSSVAAPKQAQSAADDLFGLDALTGPASAPAPAPAPAPATAPAPPQVAQSTGGSSSFATPSSPRAPGSPAPGAKSAAVSSMFKPFQPSSSFGQSMITPQGTGPVASSQVRAAPSAHDDLLGDSDETSKGLGHDSVEVGNLSNQVNTITNQTQELKSKRATAEQNVAQMSSQKRDLEGRLTQLRQAYEQEARDVRSLEDRLGGVRAENTKLQQDLAMVQHTQQNLSEQHQQIANQLADDQQENTRLKEQIAQINVEIAELKPQIEKAKSDARQQKGLVAINKKQLATVEGERDRVKDEIDQAAREHADATRELAELQSKTEALAQERENHSRDLEATRQRANTATRQRDEARSAFDVIQAPPLPTSANVGSPAASIGSMNPFFKRSATGTSSEKAATPVNVMSPPAEQVTSPNHSAFDDFFGHNLGAGTAVTSPPPTTFESFPAEQGAALHAGPAEDESIKTLDATASTDSRPATRGLEAVRIPPSPPRSRQISSSVLPLRSDAVKPPSDTSSVGVVAPASRYEGSSGFATPVERQSAGPEPSKLHQTMNVDAEQPDVPRLERSSLPPGQPSDSKELPGAFPDETPFQTPSNTGSTTGPAVAGGLAPHDTANDPFSSKPRTPLSTGDEFESAFADFGDSKGKAPERPSNMNVSSTSGPDVSAGASEFPPIQHFENDDESDSDSEAGFDDNFASPALQAPEPVAASGPATGGHEPPPIESQASPPTYDKAMEDGQGVQQASGQFPAEYSGLLPSREDPTSPSQPPHSVSSIENTSKPSTNYAAAQPSVSTGFFGGASAQERAMFGDVAAQRNQPAAAPVLPGTTQKAGFGDFDDDFNDLSEAQAEEVGAGDDLATSIASRRDTLEEFNPTFDSPAPSTRATTTTFSEPHASMGGSAFADFESSIHSGGTGIGASSAFGTASQAPSSHDWDAMFAGLDSSTIPEQANGSSLVDEAFGGAAGKTTGLAPAPEKPSLARGISQGTEHDDPILKRLMGMGFSRDESLQALEKYDYNINKAADYLTSRP